MNKNQLGNLGTGSIHGLLCRVLGRRRVQAEGLDGHVLQEERLFRLFLLSDLPLSPLPPVPVRALCPDSTVQCQGEERETSGAHPRGGAEAHPAEGSPAGEPAVPAGAVQGAGGLRPVRDREPRAPAAGRAEGGSHDTVFLPPAGRAVGLLAVSARGCAAARDEEHATQHRALSIIGGRTGPKT